MGKANSAEGQGDITNVTKLFVGRFKSEHRLMQFQLSVALRILQDILGDREPCVSG